MKSLVINLLDNDFSVYANTRPHVEGAISQANKRSVLLKRKYGAGGESDAHKKLKQYIAENPHIIGLDKSKLKVNIEHDFICGDMVDILFYSGTLSENIVVEIELDCVLPGIHQAIKYRALRCAQLGEPITSNKVKGVVVAWHFNKAEIALCNQYGIKAVTYKL
jgi:RecB family endonuclease NucS